MAGSAGLTVSVVIPTFNRPDHVTACLTHLREQTLQPNRVVVVDASPGTQTRELITTEFPWVEYLRNGKGAGSTATSRAIGIAGDRSDVVAFLDDDAYADEDWLSKLLEPYGDPAVGAVGGRALNGIAGEESQGADRVGLLLADGTLTGNFAADTRAVIDVDHLLGANMSVRRSDLEAVGGIRDHYPGTCLREETDPVLRIKAMGRRVRYTPAAVVHHVAGPYAKGRRFDTRWVYFGQRNHVVLLLTVLGPRDRRFWRYLLRGASEVGAEVGRGLLRSRKQRSVSAGVRAMAGGLARGAAVTAGLGVGLVAGTRARLADGPRGSGSGRRWATGPSAR